MPCKSISACCLYYNPSPKGIVDFRTIPWIKCTYLACILLPKTPVRLDLQNSRKFHAHDNLLFYSIWMYKQRLDKHSWLLQISYKCDQFYSIPIRGTVIYGVSIIPRAFLNVLQLISKNYISVFA